MFNRLRSNYVYAAAVAADKCDKRVTRDATASNYKRRENKKSNYFELI